MTSNHKEGSTVKHPVGKGKEKQKLGTDKHSQTNRPSMPLKAPKGFNHNEDEVIKMVMIMTTMITKMIIGVRNDDDADENDYHHGNDDNDNDDDSDNNDDNDYDDGNDSDNNEINVTDL